MYKDSEVRYPVELRLKTAVFPAYVATTDLNTDVKISAHIYGSMLAFADVCTLKNLIQMCTFFLNIHKSQYIFTDFFHLFTFFLHTHSFR